jgi:hypothetical protein
MTTPGDVIAQAERWIGTAEQPAYSNRVPGITDWYGMVGPWCAMFVSRVFADAGLPLPATTSKGFAYTPTGANWFRSAGRWHTTSPQVGDVVFFDFPGDGVNRISHVGIVVAVLGGGRIATIEGNTNAAGSRTGGSVLRHTRSSGIVGYGRPAYTTGGTDMPLSAADHLAITLDAKKGTELALNRMIPRGHTGFAGFIGDLYERVRNVEATVTDDAA